MRRFQILYFLGFFILMLPCFGNIKWGAGTEEALKYFGAGYEISDCGGGTVCYTYKNVEKNQLTNVEIYEKINTSMDVKEITNLTISKLT